jgi:hypothetical protein
MSQPAFKPERRSAKTLTEYLRAPPRASRRYVPMWEQIERARAEMPPMARSGDWAAATGLHLVALYAQLHQEVYGFEPLELDKKAWAMAAKVAARTTERFFESDYGACVAFIQWGWRREAEREAWRKANNRDGGRIGWRLQWSAAFVSDYRVHANRVGR